MEEEDSSETEIKDNVIPKARKKRIMMKMGPSLFVEVLENLSISQRDWVDRTGFGNLLSLKMKMYPTTLGYNLVSNLNTKECSLLVDGNSVSFNETDVHEILGLPKGQLKVEFDLNDCDRVEWRKQFDGKKRVFYRSLADKIINTHSSDELFQRNFICLMVSMLIELPVNSFVRQTRIGFSGDMEKCSDYNWCEFLIASLKEAEKFQSRNPSTRYYRGSMPFLVVSIFKFLF